MPPGYQPYQQHGGGPMTFAGFWSRAGGILVDGLIGVAFAVPAFVAFFAVPKHRAACTVNGERGTCDVPNGGGWAVIISLALIAAAAYLVIYIGMVGRGQSWGMKAVGNKVVLADTGQPIGTGRSIGRFFARYLSGCVFYLGYFWMLWDPKKQTWHDKMVGSVVVKA